MDTFEYEFKDFKKLQQRFDPKVVSRAANAATSRTSKKASTAINRKVREIYNVNQKVVKPKIQRVHSERFAYLMSWVGKTLGLHHFGMKTPTVRRKGKVYKNISVRIRKDRGRKRIKGAFPLVNPPITSDDKATTIAVIRKGSERLPVEKLFGPSVPQMVINAGAQKVADRVVEQEFPKEFNSAMGALLEKTGAL